jgi:hypothetical protein
VGRSSGASIEPTGHPTAGRRLTHRIGTWCRLGGRGGRGRLRRSRPRSSPPVSDDPGVVHIHGLGINPRDGAPYAATHTGLFVIREGAASRVADRYQDTMGFTVVGPDHFLGSGHGEQRRESLHPPVDGDVVDLDAALGEQLFDVAVGQAEAQVPAHRQHDDVGREAATRERRAGHGCRAGPAGSHGSSLPAQGAPNRCNSAGEGDVRAPTSCLEVAWTGSVPPTASSTPFG